MKLMTARKEYTCKFCDKKINKGEKYGKKTKSIGRPGVDIAKRDEKTGHAYHEMQGVRWTVPICESCVLAVK
jgi:hypothetical protein